MDNKISSGAEPFQQRVIEERKELRAKASALASFIFSDSKDSPFLQLESKERALLERQLNIMVDYLCVLNKRLDPWGIA